MLEGKNNWKAWLYLLPALILLGMFSFYPLVRSFIIAFIRDYHPVAAKFQENIAKYRELGKTYFTFQNIITVVKTNNFSNAIINTLLIAFISVPISVVISLIISVLLNSIKRIKGFFQTLFFLPYVTSAMAVSMAFSVLFANAGSKFEISMSPVNTVVQALGMEDALMNSFDNAEWRRNGKAKWEAFICVDKNGNIDEEKLEAKMKSENASAALIPGAKVWTDKYEFQQFLSDRENNPDAKTAYNNYRYHFKTLGYIDWIGANATWSTCIVIVLLYSIWAGLAFKILVFTGGLTSIDKQYYDAAKIDATSKWRTFWRITVPMMSPLIVYILITSLIGSFKTYTSIVGLFGDKLGPESQAGLMTTFVGVVYQYMNEGNEMIHLGAAAAVVLFVIVLIITELTNKITKKRTHY